MKSMREIQAAPTVRVARASFERHLRAKEQAAKRPWWNRVAQRLRGLWRN